MELSQQEKWRVMHYVFSSLNDHWNQALNVIKKSRTIILKWGLLVYVIGSLICTQLHNKIGNVSITKSLVLKDYFCNPKCLKHIALGTILILIFCTIWLIILYHYLIYTKVFTNDRNRFSQSSFHINDPNHQNHVILHYICDTIGNIHIVD